MAVILLCGYAFRIRWIGGRTTGPDGADELVYFRKMSGLDLETFAERMGVPASDLAEMEAGTRVIPLRFDKDIYPVVEACLDEMDDPGPMWD